MRFTKAMVFIWLAIRRQLWAFRRLRVWASLMRHCMLSERVFFQMPPLWEIFTFWYSPNLFTCTFSVTGDRLILIFEIDVMPRYADILFFSVYLPLLPPRTTSATTKMRAISLQPGIIAFWAYFEHTLRTLLYFIVSLTQNNACSRPHACTLCTYDIRLDDILLFDDFNIWDIYTHGDAKMADLFIFMI